MIKNYFADFHIHVGITESGQWVKIPTSKYLTVRNILEAAIQRKGMDIIGLVDALSPLVMADLERLKEEGLLRLLAGGGYYYKERLLLLLGAEIETVEAGGGMAHTLFFLPDMNSMKRFSRHMSQYIRNINLSSQNAHISLRTLVQEATPFEPMIIPAHIFTPFKSVYGACAERLSMLLSEAQLSRITAVELGLSADTFLADRLAELTRFTFITNSDAHSLDKIAREYNIVKLAEVGFSECLAAFQRKEGRGIAANYGLNPLLGKYHSTFCKQCGTVIAPAERASQVQAACPHCGSSRLVTGVFKRIDDIADYDVPRQPSFRPPYYYQIPLDFIPGIGKKILNKLIVAFGQEMHILHHVPQNELQDVAGPLVAAAIINARFGRLDITAGGGGLYGRIAK